MRSNRRRFSRAGLGLIAASQVPQAWGQALETEWPTPFFDQVERYLAGLRPWREDRYRLEAEQVHERLLVHNYGHGGAGITMSWGCAHEVRDLVRNYVSDRPLASVAVLGAGAMGLTAATLLHEMGLRVRVYAAGFYDETTSYIAGGQFAPALVEVPEDQPGRAQFSRILRRSFCSHEARIGLGFGVSRRPNYTFARSGSFERIPRDVVPEPQNVTRLPFQGHTASGFVYNTLLVEPPIFLAKLQRDLRRRQVSLRRRTFGDLDQVLGLEEDVIVNCMGLGAGAVCNDPKVVPIKGQLVLLKHDPRARYLYSGRGYIFPRQDGVIVGGSYEKGVTDATPDPVKCREILAKARNNFFPEEDRLGGARLDADSATPPWFYSRD